MDVEGNILLKRAGVTGEWRQLHNEELKPLNAELNPICHLLALLEAHHIFHVSGLRLMTCTHHAVSFG